MNAKDFIKALKALEGEKNIPVEIVIDSLKQALVSAIMDEKDPISNEYLLEVTSPGVERPLKTIEQFKKAIEKYVLVDVSEPVEGYDQLVGTIKNVTEDGIELEIKIKTRVKVVNIAFSIIESAMTTVKI